MSPCESVTAYAAACREAIAAGKPRPFYTGPILTGVYLAGANLAGANLAGANLAGATLDGANLAGANLARADLDGANLDGATLPAPTVVLLALWGTLPDDLTRHLMRYDAACHPDPARFDVWAAGGACPYDGVKVGRAAHFTERRGIWSPGPSERPYDLMVRVLAAKCPPWTEEQRATIAARFTTPESKEPTR